MKVVAKTLVPVNYTDENCNRAETARQMKAPTTWRRRLARRDYGVPLSHFSAALAMFPTTFSYSAMLGRSPGTAAKKSGRHMDTFFSPAGEAWAERWAGGRRTAKSRVVSTP